MKLLPSLSLWLALTSAAAAQGYLNPPPYADGVVNVQPGTNVTTALKQAYTPGDLSTYAVGPITNWTVKLPFPAFDGQRVTVGCPGGNVTSLVVQAQSPDLFLGGGPSSCVGASGTFAVYQYFQGLWTAVNYIGTGGAFSQLLAAGPVSVVMPPLAAATVGPNGSRGPLFVWNDPATSTAGQSSGLQVWVGNNPTATPAAGDYIAGVFSTVNGQGRSALWGENVLITQANLPAGTTGGPYVDGPLQGSEIDMAPGWDASPNPYLYSNGYSKNGLEVYGTAGGKHFSSDISMWSPTGTGVEWPWENLSLSRAVNYGIHLYANPSGGTDSGQAFALAGIFDESPSTSVLKVGGAHTTLFDLTSSPTLSYFVKGSATAATNLNFANGVDQTMGLTIGSGNTTGFNSTLAFADRGTVPWTIQKDPTNNFRIIDSTGAAVLTINPANDILSFNKGMSPPVATPATSSAACAAGQMTTDTGYVYICTATNTWKRAALSTF